MERNEMVLYGVDVVLNLELGEPICEVRKWLDNR